MTTRYAIAAGVLVAVALAFAVLPLPASAQPGASVSRLPGGQSAQAVSDGSALRLAARERLRAVVRAEAETTDLPADIADAVAHIESGYDADAIGTVGEIGLMQVRPTTAAMLGFRGSDSELADPRINARFGVAYLAGAWRLAKGDLCEALMKYRAGHGETTMTDRSVLYCWRARNYLRSIASSYGNAQVPREDRIREIIASLGAGGGGLSPLWMRLEKAFSSRDNASRSKDGLLSDRSAGFLKAEAGRKGMRQWSRLRGAFAQRGKLSETD